MCNVEEPNELVTCILKSLRTADFQGYFRCIEAGMRRCIDCKRDYFTYLSGRIKNTLVVPFIFLSYLQDIPRKCFE